MECSFIEKKKGAPAGTPQRVEPGKSGAALQALPLPRIRGKHQKQKFIS